MDEELQKMKIKTGKVDSKKKNGIKDLISKEALEDLLEEVSSRIGRVRDPPAEHPKTKYLK